MFAVVKEVNGRKLKTISVKELFELDEEKGQCWPFAGENFSKKKHYGVKYADRMVFHYMLFLTGKYGKFRISIKIRVVHE